MELTVGERLILLSVLPVEGNFTDLKVIRDLKMSLSFSEEEHKEYKFRAGNDWSNGCPRCNSKDVKNKDILRDCSDCGFIGFQGDSKQMRWNEDAEQVKNVEIGEKANDIIVLALSKLNEGKKLKMGHFTLYEKFIEKNKGV